MDCKSTGQGGTKLTEGGTIEGSVLHVSGAPSLWPAAFATSSGLPLDVRSLSRSQQRPA